MTAPKFTPVDLPDRKGGGRYKGAFRIALESNVGQWFEYPGNGANVHKIAAGMCSNGSKFEAAIRGGVGYMRCVKP